MSVDDQDYLLQGALALEDELVDDEDGDVDHGSYGHHDTNCIPPPRVDVFILICQRLVGYKAIQEDGLKKMKVTYTRLN